MRRFTIFMVMAVAAASGVAAAEPPQGGTTAEKEDESAGENQEDQKPEEEKEIESPDSSQTIDIEGYISDLKCAKAGRAETVGDHKDCAKRCVEQGEPIAFLASSGKLYGLVNPENARPHLGKPVHVIGILVERGKIQVASVVPLEGQ